MTASRLSILVVVRDEEKQLPACLAQLNFADQLVVVLDRCTDRSKEIAIEFGAEILEGSWDLEGSRRNAGIRACTGHWILEIDADERVSQSLAEEIRGKIEFNKNGYFLIPFDNFIGERLVRYGWGASWGVSAAPRLFAKGHKIWGNQRIHPSVDLKGHRGYLENRIDHYVDHDISDMLSRLDRYTTARSSDLIDQNNIGSLSGNIRRFFTRFIKCYFFRKGYREGAYGFLIALFAGLYPIMSHLKARLERN